MRAASLRAAIEQLGIPGSINATFAMQRGEAGGRNPKRGSERRACLCRSFPTSPFFSGSLPAFRSQPIRRASPCSPSTTGRLLILKEGAVEVVRDGVQIARVTEPGAVFGELSVLLNQPHSADLRALETSQFHVADAATLLRIDPIGLLYVATVLAQRLDGANQALIELKRQVQTGEPRAVIGKTAERMERLLDASGANLAQTGL